MNNDGFYVVGESDSGNVIGIYAFKENPFEFIGSNKLEAVKDHIINSGGEIDLVELYVGSNRVKELSYITKSEAKVEGAFSGYSFRPKDVEVIDMGDFKKLSAALVTNAAGLTEGRSFNSISIDKTSGTVTKLALTDRAKKLRDIELSWYESLGDSPYVPKIYSVQNNSFTMEYIKPDYDLTKVTANEAFSKCLEPIIGAFDNVHKVYTGSVAYNKNKHEKHIKIEVMKMIDRVGEILPYIEAFEENLMESGNDYMILRGENTEIYGISLGITSEFVKGLAEKTLKNILTLTEKHNNLRFNRVGRIHGDPNLSNIIISGSTHYPDSLDAKLIDPRGYFGESDNKEGIFGYDFAKLLYGISGYDKFNKSPYSKDMVVSKCGKDSIKIELTATNDTIDLYEHVKNELVEKVLCLDGDPFSETPTKEQKEDIKLLVDLWVGVIWINLSGYFSNNPYKAMVAYYTGLDRLVKINKKIDYINRKESLSPWATK